MRKIYLDDTSLDGCVAVYISDAEVVRAGTSVYSMPVSDKNDEYKNIAEKYDINFIFDDNIPAIDFYTIPMTSVFATDSKGGYLVSVRDFFDLKSDVPICYISSDKKCYLVAENAKEFIENISVWKNNMRLFTDIKFYSSKAEAEKENEFLDLKKLEKITDGEFTND